MKTRRNKLSQIKSTGSFKEFFLITLLFFSLTFTLNAQTELSPATNSDIKIVTDNIHRKVDIEFNSDKEISNLLVMISDSLGRTVFLDDQYRFKGKYKQSVELKEEGKGNYFVQIIKDNERFKKSIKIE